MVIKFVTSNSKSNKEKKQLSCNSYSMRKKKEDIE